MNISNILRNTCAAMIPSLSPSRVALIEEFGAKIIPLDPIGAAVEGIDLRSKDPPPEPVRQALEEEMANRGFIVFRNNDKMTADEFVEASTWWGARAIHSTHGVHPATPGGNRDIFRLSNDPRHGILGVGPQWHNDGSFNDDVFSHSGYHIIKVPENGGGTHFTHQGAAFDVLPKEMQERWSRLVSVNSNSGVLHPIVHEHPISKRKSVYLHLGMTGAVIEKKKDEDGFRLLDQAEMKKLFNDYNDLMNAGLEKGYGIPYEYQDGDCIFIDNWAVAHRASPGAHLPPEEQGLRIMHRTTTQSPRNLEPPFDLPQFMDIHGRCPFPLDKGVWQGGGVGFRWDDSIKMQN